MGDFFTTPERDALDLIPAKINDTPEDLSTGWIYAEEFNQIIDLLQALDDRIADLRTFDRARANHTGAQAISTVTNLQTSLDLLDGRLDVLEAAGGGYDKLTTSGANDGTFTFWDDTAGTGITKVNIQAGEGHVYGAAIVDVLSSAGSSLTLNYGAIALYGGEVHMNAHVYNDTNGHDAFELRSSGLGLHGNAGVFWADGSQYNTRDFGIKRASAGIGKVIDNLGALAGFQIGTLYLNQGGSPAAVLIGPSGSGPGGSGYALYLA